MRPTFLPKKCLLPLFNSKEIGNDDAYDDDDNEDNDDDGDDDDDDDDNVMM